MDHAMIVVGNVVDRIPARRWWTPMAHRSWATMVNHALPRGRIATAVARGPQADVRIAARHKMRSKLKSRASLVRNARLQNVRVLADAAMAQIQTKRRVSQVRNAAVARAGIAPQVSHVSAILAIVLATASAAKG